MKVINIYKSGHPPKDNVIPYNENTKRAYEFMARLIERRMREQDETIKEECANTN